MNTDEFLARVTPASGKHIAVAWKSTHGMIHRFFVRQDKVGEAASLLRWASGHSDAWYAVAAYEETYPGTDTKGRPILKGSRTQANASHLKCFWIDIDIKRAKSALNLYDDRAEATKWLAGFLTTVGLPAPNLVVESGYGLHVYWVLEDDMTRAVWQPYADALRDALRRHGFKCEAEISSDAARLLRAPGTANHKLGTPGVPITARSSRGDYPNELVLSRLRPYISSTVGAISRNSNPATAAAFISLAPGTATPAHSPLATGAPAPLPMGTAPNLNAAAQVQRTNVMPSSFAKVAAECAQVKLSLATGGAGEPYQLWYSLLTLASFCEDGAAYAHGVSKGDPRYSAADVDAKLAQIARERRTKPHLGPPSCTTLDGRRGGICQKCPFHGRITSPWVLGTAKEQDVDLPEGYKREAGEIKHRYHTPKMGEGWEKVVSGDVYSPVVYQTPDGYAINFMYERAQRRFPVSVKEKDISSGSLGVGAYFAKQKITLLDGEDKLLRSFVMAWIDTIRAQRGERADDIEPFGYAKDQDGVHLGIAVAGVLYRRDGTVESVPGGDRNVLAACDRKGSYAKWREAFDLVCKDSVGRQAIVAASFGAPLMHFTGQKGLLISAWGQSGIAKSAAMSVNQAVWSSPGLMSVLKSTDNAVQKKAGDMKILPVNWDEAQLNQQNCDTLIDMMFGIAQGQGKSRLNSNIELQPISTWQTLAQVCSNTKLMDFVASKIKGNDAGAARLFEYHLDIPTVVSNAYAASIIQNTQVHYGHAGHKFLQYVAMNFEKVDGLVKAMIERLIKDLSPTKEERIFVAGIAAMVVGACVAKSQGIAHFDCKELLAFFEEKFLVLRKERETLTTNKGVIDVMQILNDFMTAKQPETILTDRLARVGAGHPGKITILAEPKSGRAEVQVAEHDRMIRISMSVWDQWLRVRGHNAMTVTAAVCSRFTAVVEEKITIGAGCKQYSGGRGRALDIVLDGELADQYLTSSQQLAAAPPATPMVTDKQTPAQTSENAGPEEWDDDTQSDV